VAASKGLDRPLSEAIEPFPTQELVPYEPSYLSGSSPRSTPSGPRTRSRSPGPDVRTGGDPRCLRPGRPGDTQRNLQVQTEWSAVTYKNALLPVWIAAYDYAGKPYRFLVNGVTGKVSGKAPWSWVKIGLAVLAVATILAIILANSN